MLLRSTQDSGLMRLYREDATEHYISEKSDSHVALIWLDMGRKNQRGFTDVRRGPLIKACELTKMY